MADKATVTFYEISHCGYYRRSGDTPLFGTISDILVDINKWTTGLSLEETKTFDPPESSDLFPLYLAGATQYKGDWILAMWNHVPESEGGIASISAQSDVGSPDVEITEIKEGRIPGFATYFWFLPDQNMFATIRLTRSFTGQAVLQKYLRAFLKYSSSYVVHDEALRDSDDDEILGYTKIPDDPPLRLIPRFKAALRTNPGNIDAIAAQANKIRQLTHKEEINLLSRVPLTRWQRILKTMGVSSPKRAGMTEASMQYTADVTLNESDIRKIAKAWLDEGGPESGSDYGFRVQGESTRLWLSKAVAKDEIPVDLEIKMPEIFDLDILLESLHRQRKNMLSLIK